ncbi:MAG: acyltransferase [Rubripirellula sp.]|nr:acyltransferase [Rubripirellula sp.]
MIHPRALVDDPQCLGTGTAVWAFAHVMAGAQVGAQCNIGDHAFIESGAKVGDRVTIKNQVLLWEGVTIEDDVFVGPRATFTNDRYPRSARMEQAREKYSAKENWLLRTTVRQGCSIGANATICPGLELGRYSMIAAGAVVTADVEPYSLVMGIPARHVGYSCGCGERLTGHYKHANCEHCGETGSDRDCQGSGVMEDVAETKADFSAVNGAVSETR